MRSARRFVVLVSLLAACGEGAPTSPPSGQVCTAGPSTASAPTEPLVPLDPIFAAAAREFGVPAALLKAIGYVETRWQPVHGHPELGQPAAFGVMALRTGQLEHAAALAGAEVGAVRTRVEDNVRAAAALLSSYADELGVRERADLSAWAPAVARYSGIELPTGRASYVHHDVYATLRAGATRRDASGTIIASLSPVEAWPAYPRPALARAGASEVDQTGAVWRPSPNYGQRPTGDIGKVAMVIIHSCEGAYTGCWSWLANPSSRVSAHYVVREDGSEITQLVHEAERAWHIGSTYDCGLNASHECWRNGQSNNHFTIGVEHAGYASQSAWPAEQIDASARLVCDVTRRHGIPRDRIHIVSHAQLQPHNRTDPGPNWPWADYLARIARYCGEPAAATPLVVDSDDRQIDTARARVALSPSWVHSTTARGYHGAGYHHAGTGATADFATFSFFLPEPGTRTIEAWWAEGPTHAPEAPFVITAADGREIATVRVNQQRDGGRWNTLGSWQFPAGWNRIQLSRQTSPGCVVIADAIRVR